LRFLVFRGGALGDVLLTLPVLQALRESDPFASVELVAPFPAALLARYGGANRVADMNSVEFLSLFTGDVGLDKELRDRLAKIDCVISYLFDPGTTIRTKTQAAGCRFVSGPFRLGRRRLPATIQLAEPLGELGIQMIDPVPRLFLECKPSPRTRLVFHVGSGSRAKNWSAYCWSELVTRLEHRFEELLLVSGEADAACTAEFLRQYQNPKLKIGSSLSILDLAHELAVADLFIGHDTGVTHLAAALGVPTIALFGPTDPVIWRPLGEHVQVVASGDSTMASITVETVAELVAASGKRKKNVGDGPS
jgi:heptosyltransferase III